VLQLLINKHTIMEQQTLLSADYLDIIYDQRNKNYGGYELRKHYSQRMGKACAFMLLGVAALASFSFIPSRTTTDVTHHTDPTVLTVVDMTPPLKEIPKVKVETPPPPPPPSPVKMKINTPPVITDDLVPDDKRMSENKAMHDAVSGPSNVDVDSGAGIAPSIVTRGGGGPAVTTETKSSEPVVFVQQMPEFIGNMADYITKHIVYPEAARNSGVEGKVLVKFVVNEDGSVSNATVVRGIGGGCDEEALRIVRGMPKWKAGKKNGNAIKVYFTLPLTFALN
jgi:protein TonB